jgi:hypothetical protein
LWRAKFDLRLNRKQTFHDGSWLAYAGDRAVEVLVSVVAADTHVFHYTFPAD